MDDSEEMIENVDRIRRKLPEYKRDAKNKVDYIKKSFLLIPRKDLLEDTITTCKNTLELLQATKAELSIFYYKDYPECEEYQLEQVERNLKVYAETIASVKALISMLEKNGHSIPVEKLARIDVTYLDNHLSLLNKLLTSIELNYLTDT